MNLSKHLKAWRQSKTQRPLTTPDFAFRYAPTVNVVWVTPNGEQLIADMARVSRPDGEGKPYEELLRYLLKHKHFSPFEMVNLCVEVIAPRDISRQIIRHRSMSYQEFCIAGDSKISVSTTKGAAIRMTIEELYRRQQETAYQTRRSLVYVRTHDADTNTLIYAPLKEVFSTGRKPMFEISVGNSDKSQRKLKATKEHKFLCRDGQYRQLEAIKVGDFVGLNGVPAYTDSDWLMSAKKRSIESGRGLEGIAHAAGCSTHTIRKWLKRHDICFTKLEAAACNPIWNKGIPKEQQPGFGKTKSKDARAAMKKSAKHGADSNLYKGGKPRSWRLTVQDECYKWKLALVTQQGGCCDNCAAPVTVGDGSEIDHKLPVFSHPELALELSNLHVLCNACHAEKSDLETRERATTVRWGRVSDIQYVGEMDTYDMEVDHKGHNYVANGIVVHNSGRYAVYDTPRVTRETRIQHPTNRQMSLPHDDDALDTWFQEAQARVHDTTTNLYREALIRGVAKEQARCLLPEGLTLSRLYINGSVRSWMHYLAARLDENTVQREHMQLAKAIKLAFDQQFPTLGTLINTV